MAKETKTEELSLEFEARKTIKGFPELHWTGKRPFKSTVYYPAQLKESYGVGADKDGWMNKIFWGDNLQVMSHLMKEFRGKVDLIYIDPPFDSKADYKKKIQLRGQAVSGDSSAFEEKQYGDIWTNDEYLQFMFERLILLRELLSEKGNLFLHCDMHKNYLLRVVMDEIFGVENFKNEIIWLRSSSGKTVSRNIQKDTDSILWYAKNISTSTFYPVYKELSEKSRAMYKMNDNDGRGFYQSVSLNKTSGPGPLTTYDYTDNTGKVWVCPKSGWRMREEKLRALENDKRLIMTGTVLREKDYWDERENQGKLSNNLWDDIPNLQGTSLEISNYPTQKPELLLDRILTLTTEKGDLVFDCFMGSGTTQAVAMKLGRRFLGADINLGAVQTTTKRLLKIAAENDAPTLLDTTPLYTGLEVYNVNSYDVFRNPLEAKAILLQALNVEPLESSSVYDGEMDGRMVKIMPADVNRIATKADMEELLANLPYKDFERRAAENPREPVLKLTVVCMGHEPDLRAAIEQALDNYEVDIKVVDILIDRRDLQFKREAEGEVGVLGGRLVIRSFYPLNLLQKLSMQRENVDDWRQLVESVMVDFNYDGAVLSPSVIDAPSKNELVRGEYDIPAGAGKIMVKITDLLSESLEIEVEGR